MTYSESKRSTTNKSINFKNKENYIMNNYLAMNICEAIMPIKDDSVNVTIITNNGNVYNNVEVNDFDTKGVFFSNDKYAPYVAYDKIVEINVRNVPE